MKSKSIRKVLPRLAVIMVFLFLIVILPINLWLQIYIQHHNQQENANELFGQLEQLIQTNERELETKRREFKERCIRSADAVAFAVIHDKDIMTDITETKELAEKLEVDEIYYFTPEGQIFSGTHPKYYGYTFDSGEQMSFFKPMLQDKSLKLCQDIMPNTAEGKSMQYAAVWLEDGSGIVQIGMEPRRLQQEMEEKSLANVLAGFHFEMNGYLHIVDRNTQKIIASTEERMIDRDVSRETQENPTGKEMNMFHQNFDGKRYCVYAKYYEDYAFVRTYVSTEPVQEILQSSLMMIAYIVICSLGIIWVIRWYVRNKLIFNLDEINRELQKTEGGNMGKIVLNTGVTEFDELLFHINQMLSSIRSNRDKISYIMDKREIPIGIYEKNMFYKKTCANERIAEILGIEDIETMSTEQVAASIEEKLSGAEAKEVDAAQHIYEYDKDGDRKYLRIEKVTDAQSVIYYVTDISIWWKEINQVKEQSSVDELTGLYNRRGFYDKLEALSENMEAGQCIAMLMIDADDLKKINDTCGHHMGDKYLRIIAQTLKKTVGEHSICARLGGDEFAVLLHGFSSKEDLEQAILNIKAIRGMPFTKQKENAGYTLQFSVGIAFYPADGRNFRVLMRIADENMYQEKKSRKKLANEEQTC